MEEQEERVVVVGSGIAGLSLAHALAGSETKLAAAAGRRRRVVLLEAGLKLGGHALTTMTSGAREGEEGLELPKVDLGFQVMNRTTYPLLSELFRELGVETEPSDMSFAVSINDGELEWASHDLGSIFAQRGNLFSSRFLLMLREVFRFAEVAKEVIEDSWTQRDMTLGEYLKLHGFADSFAEEYLIPMTAAVWSVPHSQMLQFPVVPLVKFWANHHLLNPIAQRPRWRVVTGRSEVYVAAIEKHLLNRGAEIRTQCKVSSIKKNQDGTLTVYSEGERDEGTFDRVLFATHAPTTFAILQRSSPGIVSEEDLDLLSKIPYQKNDVYFHSDITQMPKLRNAWASWNVLYNNHKNSEGVCVTYWLNRLQNLPATTPTLLCTLNPITEIPKAAIFEHHVLEHPVFTVESINAQQRINDIQANATKERRVWFAGAYLGSGFHEDGIRSAMAVVAKLGVIPSFALEKHGPSPYSTFRNQAFLSVFSTVTSQFIRKGFLRVVLPSGDELGPFGRASRSEALNQFKEPACTLWVENYDVLFNCVKDSDIGLGEAYMDGLIRFDGRNGLKSLLEILVLNMNVVNEFEKKSLVSTFLSPLFGLGMLLYKLGNTWNNAKHQLRRNTVEGSRRNIQAHYDIGNPLYELFLDDTMTYSSGIHTKACGAALYSDAFPTEGNEETELSLYDAQLAKIDAIIAKLGLQKTDMVLEIGCGWGSFAIRAAETVGCNVIGITISTEQLNIAKKRVQEKGLDHLVNLQICDYRMLGMKKGTPPLGFFDKVVSIEMLEAVGEENLSLFFQKVDGMLKPGGTALIQVIGLPDDRYETYCKGSDFIREHVFPGGHLPCLGAIRDSLEGTDLILKHVDDIGPDYAITLRMWRERFLENKEKVRDLGYPERFIRLWEFYLVYCEVGFSQKSIHDWHIKFEKTSSSLGEVSVVPEQRSVTLWERILGLDQVTSTLFVSWVVLCSMAVNQIGSDALVIPLAMLFQAVPNRILGSFGGPKGQPPSKRARYLGHVFFKMLSTLLLIWLFISFNTDLYSSARIQAMIQFGHYTGELFAVCEGGLQKYVGGARIMFLSCILVFASVVLFLDSSSPPKIVMENQYLIISQFIILDLCASLPAHVKSLVSPKLRTLSFISLFSSFVIRFGGHLALVNHYQDNLMLLGSIKATLFGLSLFAWDLFDVLRICHNIWEDDANSKNTDELIRSQPEKYKKKTKDLVSELSGM